MLRLIAVLIPAAAAVAGPSEVLAPERPLELSASLDEVEEIDILTLVSIEWTPGKELPAEIKALDGKTVILKGTMFGYTEKEVSEFLMVSAGCACAGRPQPHHFVDVTLKDERTGHRYGEIWVKGVLSVGEVEEDGLVTSLYRLKGNLY